MDPVAASPCELIGPIPVTETSRPFLGAAEKMRAIGYVEEEYFQTGEARVYDWSGPDMQAKPIAGPGRYVTRLLVRRPADPARFSGNVELTVLNASLGVDLGGPTDPRRMARQGDAWIGISSKPICARALKRFDADRYAPLDWSNPAPEDARCAHPTTIPAYMLGGPEGLAAMARSGLAASVPETEDGLVWDMLGQLGLLLKGDGRQTLLPGAGPIWLYMTGSSQSSIYIRTWLAGFHDRFRAPDGRPVYDGYLGVVGPAMCRINQCGEDVPMDDPRQKLATPDVPFISISSEGEMWQAVHTRQPDAFSDRGGIVTYEVTGASHNTGEIPGLPAYELMAPSLEDLARVGVSTPDPSQAARLAPPGHAINDFVWTPLVRGAYANLQAWVREGRRPPPAPGIEVDAAGQVRRDASGNALGGVRMPYIEAPLFAHTGFMSAGGAGGVMGLKRPLPAETLSALYPDRAAYLRRFGAAADALAAARFISPEDAEAMKGAVAATPPF